MADTDFNSLSSVLTTNSTDQIVIVRSGVPYRLTLKGDLPGVDASGNLPLQGSAFPFVQLTKSGIGTWYIGGDGTSSNQIAIRFGSTEAVRFDNAGNVLAGGDNARTMGGPSNRFSVFYAGTGTINTSDEREKRQIGGIPDEWLDAWGEVEWSRFKFKGGSRWHVGLIAQRVHAAFAARGLDAFEIGLCCFDQWDEVREPVLGKSGRPTAKTRLIRSAGDRWGLRYDECFAMEAAYQRRELARLRDLIDASQG